MKSVFITGANGFVGKILCEELKTRKIPFKAGVRKAQSAEQVSYGDLTTDVPWENLLKGVDAVIHLAARVHVMNESSAEPLSEFRKMNCLATVRLAEAAKQAGVGRFIFLSSVKVNGEETFETPFHASDKSQPQDPYGVSKMEAEQALLRMHLPGVFEVVIIRPPLIYGPQVKANFQSLYRLVGKKLPLPFGLVNNRRSLVSVDNLVDLLILCLTHPAASGRVFLVSDDHDLSLCDLVREMAKAQNVAIALIPVPVSWMKFAASCFGKNSYADRLFGNLQLDISETKSILNWRPRYTFQETFHKNRTCC